MYLNWQDNDTCIQPRLSQGSASCDLSQFPAYVINASSAAEVAAGVKFAGDTGVRLIVKGTGHDFLYGAQSV